MDIVGLDVAHGAGAVDAGNRVTLGQNNTLGRASRARGVVDGAHVIPRRRAEATARFLADLLELGDREDLDALLSSQLVQNSALGVASLLTVVESVKGDDELESGDARRKLDEDRDVIHGATNDGELSMVDNVLGGVRAKCVVERDAVEGLRASSQICRE